MKIAILGSGVIGVTSAYYLNKSGYDVTIIDRHKSSALECSFANGGQLSFSHAEPWANPNIYKNLLKWAFKPENSPLGMKIDFDKNKLLWIQKFLQKSTPKFFEEHTKRVILLSQYSQKHFEELNKKLNLKYDYRKCGTLHTYRSKSELKTATNFAEFKKKLGIRYETLEGIDGCRSREPLINDEKIAGGLFFPDDACGNVHKFTKKLSQVLKIKGVQFKYNTTINSIKLDNNTIKGIETDKGLIKADKYLVCLGVYSNKILEPIGINLHIHPIKGYSCTFKLKNNEMPKICITDNERKIVYSTLKNELRIAGLADFYGFDHAIYPNKINKIIENARRLIGDFNHDNPSNIWSCLRPSTPDGIPYITDTKYDNLFINTGHGSLGWTLSCGSGKLITDIINGKKKQLDDSILPIDFT